MRLMDYALMLALLEEYAISPQPIPSVQYKRVTRTVTKSLGETSLPITLVNMAGEGRLVELSAIVTGDCQLILYVDDNIVYGSLSELAEITPFLEELSIVSDNGTYKLAIKNMYFSRRLTVILRGEATLKKALVKVEKYEWRRNT